MTRLFLSLYLFIAVTLVVLSALLNQVFFEDSASKNTDKVTSSFVDIADMAWTEDDLQRLQQGETLNLFGPKNSRQLYTQIDDNRLLEITIVEKTISDNQTILYSAAFFVALGVLIALWAWPLWRDLQALKRATKSIDVNGNVEPISIESHSLVYPIAVALQELGKRINELLNTQRELTGAVAHEFRTPLARLKFALATQNDSSGKQTLAMNEDINELEKLVQEMLSYTSMESQEPELNITDIPVELLCKERVAQLSSLSLSSLSISVEGSDAFILADAHYAERAIDNLLLNACRYAKSKIVVSIEEYANSVFIKVADDGPGVAEKYADKVFQPFFRPESSRDRKQGGAGLGLAIVKRIMAWHGGRCYLEQSKSGGACFVLCFTNEKH